MCLFVPESVCVGGWMGGWARLVCDSLFMLVDGLCHNDVKDNLFGHSLCVSYLSCGRFVFVFWLSFCAV